MNNIFLKIVYLKIYLFTIISSTRCNLRLMFLLFLNQNLLFNYTTEIKTGPSGVNSGSLKNIPLSTEKKKKKKSVAKKYPIKH